MIKAFHEKGNFTPRLEDGEFIVCCCECAGNLVIGTSKNRIIIYEVETMEEKNG